MDLDGELTIVVYRRYRANWRVDPLGGPVVFGDFYEHIEDTFTEYDVRLSTVASITSPATSADGSGAQWKLIVLPDGSLRPVPVSVNAPAAPTELTASTHLSFINLTWNAPSSAVSYQLYRDGILLASPASPAWNDAAGITIGSTYAYTVIALNAYGMWSPASTAINAFVDPALNSPPVFESITVWPANPTATDTVYVHVNGHDVDAQQLSFALTSSVGTLTPIPNDPTTWTWTGS